VDGSPWRRPNPRGRERMRDGGGCGKLCAHQTLGPHVQVQYGTCHVGPHVQVQYERAAWDWEQLPCGSKSNMAHVVRTRARAADRCCARVIYFHLLFVCLSVWIQLFGGVRLTCLCLRVVMNTLPSACFYLLSAVYEDVTVHKSYQHRNQASG
jgi:hypothetical protein